MHILVTGGAGYIGSHTIVKLHEAGHTVTVLDNLDNSSPESLERVKIITGRRPALHVGDIRDTDALNSVFERHDIDAVIHFAGLKAVGESHERTVEYYAVNVGGTINLLDAMERHGVRRLVFSSSATVYGAEAATPTQESHPLSASNPYGRTKLMVEDILRDAAGNSESWSIAVLRYFNPAGAHPSGLIGEDPKGIPNNLVPYVCQVAAGARPQLKIFGNDYPTPDGTGVRDFIHVVDLAEGHVAALNHVSRSTGLGVWNLGTGRGYSVLDIVRALEQITGAAIPHEFVPRRQGDAAISYADVSKAAAELGWRSQRALNEILEDHWRWQSDNPSGYAQPTRDGLRDTH